MYVNKPGAFKCGNAIVFFFEKEKFRKLNINKIAEKWAPLKQHRI